MSRKKHAWTALEAAMLHHEATRDNTTFDDVARATRGVELAILEDFMDHVYEQTEHLFIALEQAPNNDVKLGMLLAQNVMRATLEGYFTP